MKIDVLTLFPKMFDSPFAESMMQRAIKNGKLELNLHDLRQWAWNSYGSIDDKPYGGDVGMLIRVDVIDNALRAIKFQTQNSNLQNSKTAKAELHKIATALPTAKPRNDAAKVILTSARGKRFSQETAERWSKEDNLIFICGHYEGVDQRVADYLIDEEVSIGDFVVTGGELPAMLMIDATVRLLPGVLGKDESSKVESFSPPLRHIEHPQYTRPAEYNGWKVPEELLSGDPKKIREWQERNQKVIANNKTK